MKQKSKPQSKWARIPQRKKAIKLFNEGRTINEIVTDTGLTWWQVYNAVSGRTKARHSPRKDKGQKRTPLGVPIDNKENPTDLTAFTDPDDFLKFQTMRTLEKLNSSTLQPEDSVKALKDCSKILSDIHNREMQRHIKRGDAEIISRIIKRYVPDATDEDVIKIYSEELSRFECEVGQ